MNTWTKEQSIAIEDRGGTLLVSAAAGSGKTAVLTERAVRLITDTNNPISADRLLVVTFSNASAAEMKARISKRLDEEFLQDPHNRLLSQQKLLLGRAKIETVHAFCLDLLKEFFGELDIPPDFTVADETAVAPIREAALAEIMEEFYVDENFIKLAGMYGRARNDTSLRDIILGLYNLSRSLPFPEAYLQKIVNIYKDKLPFEDTAWGKELLEYGLELALEAQAGIEKALNLTREVVDLQKHEEVFAEDYIIFENIIEMLNKKEWNKACLFCKELGLQARRFMTKNDTPEQLFLRRAYSNAKKKLEKIQKNVLICTTKEYEIEKKEVAPLVQVLCTAVSEFQKRFFEMKKEEKALEFSDFEHLTVQLLLNRDGTLTEHARIIQNRFDVIMVDEFQDTSTIQNQIFEAVANTEQSNLFFVGDAKQSIYRFRQANPLLFIQKKKDYNPVSTNKYPATVVLGHNFRSSKPVIDGVNDVFSALMCEEVGEIDYSDEEYLVQGNNQQQGTSNFEFHLIEKGEEFETEAEYVAKLINKSVKNKETVQEKDGTLRPCNYGDFCILLRAPGKSGQEYLEALQEYNIPAYSDQGQDISASWVLQPIIATLQTIDNPAKDVPLIAAMLSPLFGFTPDDVNAIREKQMRGPFYAAVLRSEDEKVKNFLLELDYYRNISIMLPVHEVVEEVLKRTGYGIFAGMQQHAGQAFEEIRSFIKWAESYSTNGKHGLSGFLKTVETAQEAGGYNKPLAAANKTGQVSIMSIHRSKGLEFPFCILSESGKLFNKMDMRDNVSYHPELGVGFSLRTPINTLYTTLPKLAIAHRIEKELLSEEMRLLYVALTRARQSMVITATTRGTKSVSEFIASEAEKIAEGITINNIYEADSVMKWLLYTFLTHENGDTLRNEIDLDIPIRNTNGELSVVLSQNLQEERTEKQTESIGVQVDEALVKEIIHKLNLTYAYEAETQLPIKTSVSDIVKENEETYLTRPSFMNEEGLSAAEKGTALHNFMQYANLKSASENFEAEKEHLMQKAFLTKAQAEAIPQKSVDTFLQSNLAQRMLKAEKTYKEYAFITDISAEEVIENWSGDKTASVIMQGVADCIFIEEDGAILIDYKSDRVKTADELIKKYAKQLELYKKAIEPRLNTKIKESYIYSFYLGKEVEVE